MGSSIKSLWAGLSTKIKPKPLGAPKPRVFFPLVTGSDVTADKDTTFDWCWKDSVLKVERAFGKNEEISGRKMERLRWMFNYALRTKSLAHYHYTFHSVADGGTFWDSLMFRGAGDTPIAICEHILPCINLDTQLNQGSVSIDFGWLRFIKQCADYVYSYRPAALNNHLTFKAAFLLSYGLTYGDKHYAEWAYGAWDHILNQIDEDGYMPLELERGNKAASYSRMNLEAINYISDLLKAHYDIAIHSKVSLANRNFYCCLTDHESWRSVRNLPQQRLPERLQEWGWVLRHSGDMDINGYHYYNYRNKSRNQNSYLYNYLTIFE